MLGLREESLGHTYRRGDTQGRHGAAQALATLISAQRFFAGYDSHWKRTRSGSVTNPMAAPHAPSAHTSERRQRVLISFMHSRALYQFSCSVPSSKARRCVGAAARWLRRPAKAKEKGACLIGPD